ncbi:hypothetical protein H6F43_04090 [Leptolyngbya sp. FACHB-36]|uniref:hypothetical protein n=1 Tax=Leptolyngbya sp. FACHB-36 TaxID=2692808 RepID=UPI001681954A|nr:hypothetical protein [Leptolyngbya sp. FACHB-36]MBD2019363.1 hypothetical protein [Leptolyngbya sp. FACHB-36]
MPEINIKANDLEILWVEPGVDGGDPETDQRVPSAQELAAANHLHQSNLKTVQEIERPAGLRTRPAFDTTGSKGIILPAGLAPYAPGHPSIAPFASDVTVMLPPLADAVSSISRYDRLYLMTFGVVITSAIDPDILLTFEWENQSGAIQTLSKENTRRIRSVWAIVWSQGPTTAADVVGAMSSVSGKKALTVAKGNVGITLNTTLRIYPLDPNLTDAKTYFIVQDTLTLIDLCRVWRVQNFTQTGYMWGRGGEKQFETDFHIQPTYRYVGDGWEAWDSRSRETLRRIFLGLPLIESPSYDRAVQNLINGQVGVNLDAPGTAIASPNGSTALANGQRVSFTNQRIVQKTYCLPVQTIDASGFARATVPFQTNSPVGAKFSQDLADHKVYKANGVDVTLDGTITGLGGSGALVWTANSNAVVAVGDTVYVQPGISYPEGSGFALSGEIEKVYYNNGLVLNTANVREASVNNLNAYTNPASGESFIAVLGKERAALHYIYQRLTIISSSAGVVTIPGTVNGAIAFISGPNAPTGRIDRPVIAGLAHSTNYSVLCYYPPKATDNWQFQLKTSRYAGTGERALLDGARVATLPIAIGHTQGGGNSTFLADGELQYEAISFRLPANTLSNAVKHVVANYRMQLAIEGDIGANSVRELPLSAASGLVLPRSGMTLAAPAASSAQSKGMAVKLANSAGQALGILKLPIQCAQVYQLVVAFVVLKDGERRLCLITLNEGDTSAPSGCRFDSDSPHFAGVDTFALY